MKDLCHNDIKAYWIKKQQDPSNEKLKKPANPSEFMLEPFMLQFIASYLKEMKHDSV